MESYRSTTSTVHMPTNSMCFLFVYILLNTLKAIGNFDGSADYIRGRIHLCDIADNYKKKIKLKADEDKSIAKALKTTTDQTIDGLKTRRKRILVPKVKIISFSAARFLIKYSFQIFFNIFNQLQYDQYDRTDSTRHY